MSPPTKVAGYLSNELHKQIKQVSKELQNYDAPDENSGYRGRAKGAAAPQP